MSTLIDFTPIFDEYFSKRGVGTSSPCDTAQTYSTFIKTFYIDEDDIEFINLEKLFEDEVKSEYERFLEDKEQFVDGTLLIDYTLTPIHPLYVFYVNGKLTFESYAR